MIVVNTKEAKEPSGLSQLLLGKQNQNDTKFANFLEAFNLSGNLENEEFNLEKVIENIVIPKNINTKISDPRLVVDDNGDKKAVVNVQTDAQTILKETTLLNLLQGEKIKSTNSEQIQNVAFTEEDESYFLHPKMINTLETKNIKLVVNSAKIYLREQIDSIIKEQNIDVKNMPQTLKGLSEMAKKLGVNLEKITLETIVTPKIKEQISKTKESIPLLDMKKQKMPIMTSIRTAFVNAEEIKTKKQEPLQKALYVKSTEDVKTASLQVKSGEDVKTASLQVKSGEDVKIAPLHVKSDEDVKIAPLHVKNNTTTNTSELNSAHLFDIEEVAKPSKIAQTNPLTALLQGEAVSEDDTQVSVKTDITQTKITQSSFVNLPDGDSLEVKAKEAQQVVRHFASDLKEAVENYKPPFTRLKMTLNPAKLGEVDVTLIQRGNNVHINISSNNSALTLLAHNINELKTQLANNGVVSTSMQFSTSHGEQQQQREGQHQQFQAYKDFNQLSEEELEMITSMEIILPKYV